MNDARIDTSTEPTSDPLRDKIERLLVRHEESRRTVALLETQVKMLTQERDSLQARLHSASLRMTAVLAQLPNLSTQTVSTDTPKSQSPAL